MRPFTYSVYELFEKDRRHLVPLFQRPYVWKQNKQWQPLWEDITTKAEDLLKGGHHVMHFMGAAVLREEKSYGKQVKSMTVIDGQQRLTTLQLILVALRDLVREIGQDERLLKRLEKLTENDWREDPEERFKVWPTNIDRTDFENVVSARSLRAVEDLYQRERHPTSKNKWAERPALVEGYLYFAYQIREYVWPKAEDEHTPELRLEAIYQTLVDHFQLVVIELEENDNPQIIFETLNARGEPLYPSDLIRNFVFLEASKNHEDIEVLYNNYWGMFDESTKGTNGFWKEMEQQGRLNRPRLDLLIFHYLVYKSPSEIAITSLFEEFSKWWRHKSPELTPEEHLQDLQHFAKVFRSFYESKAPTRVGVFVNRLRALDTSTVFPLLLFLFGEGQKAISQKELDGIVTDLESYLVRRMVCGLSSKNYNRFFLGVLQQLSNIDKNQVIDRQLVQNILRQSTAPATRWPDDQEFRQAWLKQPLYSKNPNNRRRTLMLLTAMDLQLTTNKQELLHIDKESISIEHIYPQNPETTDWPMLDHQDENAVLPEDLIHTIGNLTLVTKLLNSSVGNGPFKKKAAEIASHSALRLNVYFQNPPKFWGREEIEARSLALFDIARQIWTYPQK